MAQFNVLPSSHSTRHQLGGSLPCLSVVVKPWFHAPTHRGRTVIRCWTALGIEDAGVPFANTIVRRTLIGVPRSATTIDAPLLSCLHPPLPFTASLSPPPLPAWALQFLSLFLIQVLAVFIFLFLYLLFIFIYSFLFCASDAYSLQEKKRLASECCVLVSVCHTYCNLACMQAVHHSCLPALPPCQQVLTYMHDDTAPASGPAFVRGCVTHSHRRHGLLLHAEMRPNVLRGGCEVGFLFFHCNQGVFGFPPHIRCLDICMEY